MTRTYILLAVLLLMGLSGCDRYVDSRDPIRSLPSDLATPINVQATLNSESVTLAWELADSTGVARFRVYVSSDTLAGYRFADSSTTYEATIDGLALNRTYYFRVATVDVNGFEGRRSDPVSAHVSLLAISINDNNEYTNSASVRVQLLAAAQISHVYLSEDVTMAGAPPRPFSSTVNFTLSSGDGPKTVFARFVFFDGAESGTSIADSIILDTRAQIDSVRFAPTGTTFTSGDTILFRIATGEPGGEATATLTGTDAIRLADDGTGGDATAADGIYSARWIVPFDFTLNNEPVVGNFTDAAGNSVTQSSTATLSIFSTPLPVQLTLVEATESYEITLTWSQAASSDFASYRVYRATSINVDETSPLLTTITGRSNVTFVDTTVNPSTTYNYRVFVRNSLGQSAGSNTLYATTTANVAPAAVVLAGVVTGTNSVVLTWTQSPDADFSSYQIYRGSTSAGSSNTSGERLAVISNKSTTTTTHNTSSSTWYRIYVYDRQGSFTSSDPIQVTN